MSEKQIIVIGAGGHGKEVLAYLHDLIRGGNKIRMMGFIDDEKPKGPFAGSVVLGNLEDLRALLDTSQSEFHYITAVGHNEIRKQLVERIQNIGAEHFSAWTLCHPTVYVGPHVRIGEGTCLAPGSFVTTHVDLGKHCIVNVNSSISHDCTIGDFVNINPRVAIGGNVKIGEGCYIGAGATIIDKVSIGPWTIIGAGAVVTENLPAHVTAVGVPARIIKQHTENRSATLI